MIFLKKHKVWVLLGITLLLAYFAPPKDNAAVAQATNVAQTPYRDSVYTPSNKQVSNRTIEVLDLLERLEADDEAKPLSVFATMQRKEAVVEAASFTEPETTTADLVEQAEVATPQAPAILFKLLGQYQDEQGHVVFINHKNKNLVLHIGDTFLDNKYRLDEVEAKTLTFTYLPMGIKQKLDLAK